MKRRRNLIVVLLLISAMALGVGYAALSRELLISSQANLTAKQNNLDVIFTDAEVTSTTATDKGVAVDKDTVASATYTATNANYSITGLSKAGEQVVLTFTIRNNSADVDAYLKDVSTTAGSLYLGEGTSTPGNVADYFDKDIVIENQDGTTWDSSTASTNIFLEKGKTATVKITITLKKTLGVEYNLITLTGGSVHLDFVNVIE